MVVGSLNGKKNNYNKEMFAFILILEYKSIYRKLAKQIKLNT